MYIMPFELTDQYTCADIGMLVSGTNINILFSDAAAGLTSIMVEPDNLEERKRFKVTLDADDVEGLFFNWLSEIIYFKDAERFFPKRCEFEYLDGNGKKLAATLHGDIADPERHILKTDVKAVTYYRFKVEKVDGLWKAEVVLDI